MAKFVMLGRYSPDAIKGITGERTKKGAEIIKKAGGKINSMFALLGDHDLLLIVDFPGITAAMKASVALSKITGISFNTSIAVSVEEFDKIVG